MIIMKGTIKIAVIAAIGIAVFFGCKKNIQDTDFKDVDRITLEGLPEERPVADSLNYSFSISPTTTTAATLTLVVKLGGNVVDTDRNFKLEVDAAKTTADASEYTLPTSFTIKAGKVATNIPVTLKRSSRIADRSIKLTIKAVANENFQVGRKSSFTFIWTDDVVKPVTWTGSLQFALGNYSKVKHRLVLSSTEYKDLNLIDATKDNALYDVIYYIASATLAKLNEYNTAHPGAPLRNEFGEVIEICGSCK